MLSALRTAYLVLLAVFILTPMLIIVIFSFDANRFPALPWGGFTLNWHREALADAMIVRAIWNSVSVSLATAVIATFLGFCAAYLDYRYAFFGKRGLILMVAVPPAVPVSILGMAMLAALSRTPMFGTPLGIVVCHAAIAVSFAMALVRLRLSDLGPDLEQAAWNLGASQWSGLVHVVIPFCRPSLIAAFCLSAAISFDEFMVAWFVGGVNETLSVRVFNMLLGQVNPKINAIGTLVLITSVVLVSIAQVFARIGRTKEVAA